MRVGEREVEKQVDLGAMRRFGEMKVWERE